MFIISPPFQHVNHRGFLSLNHIFNGPWHFDRQTDGPAGRERTRLCLREGHSWWICLFCQLQRDVAVMITSVIHEIHEIYEKYHDLAK